MNPRLSKTLTDVTVARSDCETVNGRRWSHSVLQSVADTVNTAYVTTSSGAAGTLCISDITHEAKNFRMVNSGLCCDLQLLPTPAADQLEADPEHFHIYGSGDSDHTQCVNQFELVGISIHQEPVYRAGSH